jgi:undecaprenyl-diphosphatase
MKLRLHTSARVPELERAIGLQAAACALLALVLALASRLVLGDFGALDRTLLVAVRQAVDHRGIGWETLRRIMLLATTVGAFPTLAALTLVASALLIIARRGATAMRLVLCAGSGVAAANLVKDVFVRTRPDVVPHWVEVSSLSFPSGHSADASIVYLLLAVLAVDCVPRRSAGRGLAAAAFALVLLVGLSRVYLGVHWPTDVLAGWAFGAAWAFISAPVVTRREGPSEFGKVDRPPRARH